MSARRILLEEIRLIWLPLPLLLLLVLLLLEFSKRVKTQYQATILTNEQLGGCFFLICFFFQVFYECYEG